MPPKIFSKKELLNSQKRTYHIIFFNLLATVITTQAAHSCPIKCNLKNASFYAAIDFGDTLRRCYTLFFEISHKMSMSIVVVHIH